MDAQCLSSISSGLTVYRILIEDVNVSGMATRIFPVAITSESVSLPFIVYRTVKQDPVPAKPQKGADICQIAVDCVASGYKEAVELAEYARAALESDDGEGTALCFSSCLMTDREEFFEDDAYVERLIFTITI